MIDANPVRSNAITRILSGEMFKAMGFAPQGWVSRLFSPLVQNPIHHFSEIAVGFDQRVTKLGFSAASRWILPNFVRSAQVVGAEVVPKEGPLIIASNHPGAFDALVITANIPRDDIKIVVNIPLPFIQELPATQPHFLYAPPDPHVRIGVVRSAIRHLREGGALLLFASGGMDPDPASMPGAEDAICNWSGSLELFLRQVPQTLLEIAMISGILMPKYVRHIFTHFRRQRLDKQRISEFFQVIRQMASPGELLVSPSLSFAHPLSRRELSPAGDDTQVGAKIVQHAQELLNLHTQSIILQAPF